MTALSIAFVDFQPRRYDVETARHEPLGGSESALCYLAVELAKRGHRIAIFNNPPAAGVVAGVQMVPREGLPDSYLAAQNFDAVIVLNGPAEASALRADLPRRTALALWTQHDCDIPAVAKLANADVRRRWDKIVCISDWQRNRYIDVFRADPDRLAVLRNAIAPVFESLFADADDLRRRKAGPLRLAYTSTPFRGLNVLLEVFPRLERDCRLEIYSSMQVYAAAHEDARFAALYNQARQTPNVSYIGSVPQPQLAAAMTCVSVLSYPNIYPETSCIAVMEALAAGAFVLTSDLGALPETTLGLGSTIPNHQKLGLPEFARHYLAHLRAVIDAAMADPQGFAAQRYDQVQVMNRDHVWRVRAVQWEQAIRLWLQRREVD